MIWITVLTIHGFFQVVLTAKNKFTAIYQCIFCHNSNLLVHYNMVFALFDLYFTLRTCSLKWGTNVANTKTAKTYILDYLEKYRTLNFQTLRDMFHVVISRLHLQISNSGPVQQTIEQKQTLWLFDQLCVNQTPLTTFKVSVALLDGSTYRKNLQHINLSEHKTDYFLTIWKIIDLLVFCHMNASMILWLLCTPFS